MAGTTNSMTSGGLPGRSVCGAVSAALMVALAGLGWVTAPAQAAVAGSRPHAGTVTTIAGGIGGPGPARNIAVQPCAVKSVPGALYLGGGSVVRRVDSRTGWLTNPVTNVPLSRNSFNQVAGVCGVTTDRAGNLLVADSSVVRVVAKRTGRFYGRHMSAGHSYTIAGRLGRLRDWSHTGNFGPATRALLSDAADVTLDHAGNVLIADAGQPSDHLYQSLGAMVRVVAERSGRFYGRQMIAGNIYTIAGAASGPSLNGILATTDYLGLNEGTVRVDHAGNLVLAASSGGPGVNEGTVWVVAERTGAFYDYKMTAGHVYAIAGHNPASPGNLGDGVLSRRAALEYAGAAAIDRAGNVVIADCNRVRVVAVRSGRFYGQKMTPGHIYSIAGNVANSKYCSAASRASGDGGPGPKAVINALWVTVDSAGSVVIADAAGRVRVVAERTGHFYGEHLRAGDIYSIAGNGQPQDSGLGLLATRAEVRLQGLTADHAGEVVVSSGSGQVLMVPEARGRFFGRTMLKGHLYAIAGSGHRGKRGNGGPAIKASMAPGGLAIDAAGNLLVADASNDEVRVVAARAGVFYRQHMKAAHIYRIAGDAKYTYSGDGGLATKAGLFPSAIAIDRAGNVLVADNYNDQIRMVAVRSGTYYGQHTTAAHIYTIAGDRNAAYSGDGGPATKAGLNPQDIAIDRSGNVVVADAVNSRIRVVAARSGKFYGRHMAAGHIYTIAGNGSYAYTGDGGPAAKATFGPPAAVAIDSTGNVAIADQNNAVIRMVAARSGTFYGKKMTAGRIYTIAGTRRKIHGHGGALGDGGPATRATLSSPQWLAIGRAGSLLIGDFGASGLESIQATGRVRSVSR